MLILKSITETCHHNNTPIRDDQIRDTNPWWRDPGAVQSDPKLKALERVNWSLGAPLAWHALAEDMDVTQPTARDYVHLLAQSFMLLVIFFSDRSGRGLSPQKQRMIYGIDPLVNRVPRLLVPGARAPEDDAIRESNVASGLFRSATERLVQAEPVVGSVGFWKSGRGTEIDFLIAAEVPGGRLPIEVKGDAPAGIGTARRSIGSAFGRGHRREVTDL